MEEGCSGGTGREREREREDEDEEGYMKEDPERRARNEKVRSWSG